MCYDKQIRGYFCYFLRKMFITYILIFFLQFLSSSSVKNMSSSLHIEVSVGPESNAGWLAQIMLVQSVYWYFRSLAVCSIYTAKAAFTRRRATILRANRRWAAAAETLQGASYAAISDSQRGPRTRWLGCVILTYVVFYVTILISYIEQWFSA